MARGRNGEIAFVFRFRSRKDSASGRARVFGRRLGVGARVGFDMTAGPDTPEALD
jgi:hypothetical protein